MLLWNKQKEKFSTSFGWGGGKGWKLAAKPKERVA